MRPDVHLSSGSHISVDDSRTCYDLGVAFLTMGLAKKGLFHLINAATNPEWLPACSAALGGHFLDHGAPRRAAAWYRRGLSSPAIDPETRMVLSRGLIRAKGVLDSYVILHLYRKARRTKS